MSTSGQQRFITARVFSRKALFNVQAENTHLRDQLQLDELEDEDELDVTIEGAEEDEEEEEEMTEMWDMWDGQISLSNHQEKSPSQLPSSTSQVGGAPDNPKLKLRILSKQKHSSRSLQLNVGCSWVCLGER